MKLFLKYIGLFSIPFLVLFVVILCTPYSKKYGYHFRKNVDCNTSWIYYRLFENPTPIDVAFLGTSHTGCGINDSLIERVLKTNHNKSIAVANMSYCTNGRNIQYPLLNDILSVKSPKLVVIEVMEIESVSSHQDFTYIADYATVFSGFSAHNFHFVSEIGSLAKSRFNFIRDEYVYRKELIKPSNYTSNHMYQPFDFIADSMVLAKDKAYKINKLAKGINGFSEYKMKYPKEYLIKMVDRLNEKNIPFVFLYIPPFGLEIEKPLHYAFLSQYGNVWIPPAKIFENKMHWADGEHLNYEGTKILGNWLVDEINKKL